MLGLLPRYIAETGRLSFDFIAGLGGIELGSSTSIYSPGLQFEMEKVAAKGKEKRAYLERIGCCRVAEEGAGHEN